MYGSPSLSLHSQSSRVSVVGLGRICTYRFYFRMTMSFLLGPFLDNKTAYEMGQVVLNKPMNKPPLLWDCKEDWAEGRAPLELIQERGCCQLAIT